MRSRGSLFNHSRLESRKTTRPVRFLCSEKNAQRVTLMGDFNQWNAESHPMERQFDGVWRLELELDHGHHRYLFNVDGNLALDPKAQGTEEVDGGGHVSVVAVS